MSETEKKSTKGSNGFLLSIIAFACQEYGWNVSYVVEDVPMVFIMLLTRQKVFSTSDSPGFTLLEQEEMDRDSRIPWEERVRLNRERLRREGKI